MATEIKSNVTELESIIQEQKRLRIELKKLNDRKKELEKYIDKYLETKGQPGLKNNSIAIIKKEKEVHKRVKQKEAKKEAVKFLKDQGVRNPEEAYNNLIEKMKGEAEVKSYLKIEKLKK